MPDGIKASLTFFGNELEFTANFEGASKAVLLLMDELLLAVVKVEGYPLSYISVSHSTRAIFVHVDISTFARLLFVGSFLI